MTAGSLEFTLYNASSNKANLCQSSKKSSIEMVRVLT